MILSVRWALHSMSDILIKRIKSTETSERELGGDGGRD